MIYGLRREKLRTVSKVDKNKDEKGYLTEHFNFLF